MPAFFDLAYVALFAVAWPIYDYFVEWPKFKNSLRVRPGRARLHGYLRIICVQWLLVAVGVVLWIHGGRAWPAPGLSAPEGWRLRAGAGIVALLALMFARNALAVARSSQKRERIRSRLKSLGQIMPHTTGEFRWFLVVSLTAGVCEEFLFRGYFIWTLAPWLSWWGAAALSAAAFGLLHAYQGRSGIISTTFVGVLMTLLVVATRSLLPAMALHALVDAGNGTIIWFALREQSTPEGDAAEAQA